MGEERKFTKRQYRACLKRTAEAMREASKAKKNNKTLQDAVVGGTDIQHVTMKNDNLECKIIKEEINIVFEPEEIEENVKSGDDTKQNIYEQRREAPCENQSNEEVWLVRRQLCRGCHSDGAFWSLQTTTEGDTYADLLQTYFNIQLCPVSEDEQALSAICSLCAARLRDARAFSAQAHAAEERFTRLYKKNRFRVFVKEELIKKEVEIFNEADDSQSQITDDVKPDTENSNLDDLQAPVEELPQVLCNKPAPKKYPDFGSIHDDDDFDVDFPCIDEGQPKRESKRKKVKKKRVDKKLKHNTEVDHASDEIRPTASKRNITPAYRLSPSDYERIGDALKCARCEKQFNSVKSLRIHVKSLHMNIANYTCTLCVKTFHTLAPFTKHKLDEHSVDDRIKCNACDSIFNTRTQLVKHKKSFHMLGVKHACPHCDYECFGEEGMYKHKFKHKSVKDYQCKYCRKSFLRKTTLDLHERIHTGDRRKVCNECGQAFVQKASLNYHMAKYHPEVKF